MNRFEALLAALRRLGKKSETREEEEQAASDAEQASDLINEVLPEDISGRRAILAQRKKMQLMDEIDRSSR